MGYAPDDSGMFTDTDNYTEIVPECTNLSVGYFKAHTANEWLDWEHLDALLTALKGVDINDLPIKRDPSVYEDRYAWWERQDLDDWYRGHSDRGDYGSSSRVGLIRNNPEAISQFLDEWGVSDAELSEIIMHHSGCLKA